MSFYVKQEQKQLQDFFWQGAPFRGKGITGSASSAPETGVY